MAHTTTANIFPLSPERTPLRDLIDARDRSRANNLPSSWFEEAVALRGRRIRESNFREQRALRAAVEVSP